jgi:hypothetical protein
LGRTVAELEASLSNAEWVGWRIYYARIAQQRELEQLKARGGSHYG